MIVKISAACRSLVTGIGGSAGPVAVRNLPALLAEQTDLAHAAVLDRRPVRIGATIYDCLVVWLIEKECFPKAAYFAIDDVLAFDPVTRTPLWSEFGALQDVLWPLARISPWRCVA